MQSEYKKTIVAVIGAVISILAIYGVDIDPELSVAVTTILTAVAVWWFKNEGPA